MHILHINKYDHLRGGADRHFLELTELLKARGHKVTKFTLRTSNDSNIEHKELLPFGLTADELLHASFGKKIRGGLASVYSINNARKLKHIVKLFQPDIAHLHNIYYQLSGSILPVLQRASIPIIQTIHDFQWFCPAGPFYRNGEICQECVTQGLRRILIHLCYRNSFMPNLMAYFAHVVEHWLSLKECIDKFIAPSSFVKSMLSKLGIPDDKIVVIPHFTVTPLNPPNGNPGKTILYIGRLVPEKGIELLIKIAERMRHIPFHFAGDGEMRIWLENKAREMRNIKVLGPLDRPSLSVEMNLARAVIVPSQCYEVFGLAVIEAYSYGKPVIVSGLGALSEIVQDGETGYIVSDNQIRTYCDAIDSLFSNDREARRMGINSYKYVITNHNPKTYVDNLKCVYDSLISATKET